ncbi:pituitary tumor-transforming gene 1 protein-interacting protein-like [Heterodontus francisci]|uniref:pituitary tumor-transforming gene 1 protein-interacting protein-like n=1 Tax=Heterodontus francisci TaxID=7792 RepID=UPI00355C2239
MELLRLSTLFIVLLARPGGCQVTDDPPSGDCSDYTSTSCEECLDNVNCLWCFVDQRCMTYPVGSIIPPSSICPLHQARWGVCWVSFESLIIAMSVVVGLILLPLVCCCCYCCCKKKSHGHGQEEERLAKQQEERKQRSEERMDDRKARYDEIRKKYGLLRDSDHPYSRFENE